MTADSLYFSGITEEIRIQNRRDMLATDRAALLSWADTLDGMKEKNTVCVVAKEDTLRAIDGLIVTEL